MNSADATPAPPSWHETAARDLTAKLDDRAFPCIFARNAHRKNLVETLFVDDALPASLDALADGITDFVERCRGWDGRLDSAPPLVVLFHPRCNPGSNIDEYHRFGWRILGELHCRDRSPWPAQVPTDPNHPLWSMCFAGMPLFVNMSTPAHRRRRSRNLGECFAFVINPRERFDVVAGDTPRGRKARATIRGRILAYDGMPAAGDLATYGSGSPEWKQYEIKDDDLQPHEACPFAAAPSPHIHGHAA